MSKINSRRKGHGAERELVGIFKSIFPDVKRHLEFQKQEAEAGVDLDNTNPFLIQSKIGKQVPKKNYQFLAQIKDKKGQYKLVVCRRDREKWLAIMDFDDFFELVQMLKVNNIL